MATTRKMSVHEALEYLEGLEVSSDDESGKGDEFIYRGTITISPPITIEGRETDEESGDEYEADPNRKKFTTS